MGIVQDASSVVHCRRMGIGAVTPIKYYLADKRSRCNEGKELIEGRPPAKELCKKVDQEICACVQNCGTTDLELVCAPCKTSFFWDVAEEQKSEWYEACDAIRQDKKAATEARRKKQEERDAAREEAKKLKEQKAWRREQMLKEREEKKKEKERKEKRQQKRKQQQKKQQKRRQQQKKKNRN